MSYATKAQLNQARRNQEFQNIPMGSGQCGLMQKEVAVFPVRYAVDESPQKGSSQGPNPLPKNWSNPALPPLKTRSYTLRQLRDGWLYVWSSIDETFHEYQVEREMLIRHEWTERELNQDTRHNPGQARQYLLYSRRTQLRIAYSPVQWTWRMCELMRSSAAEQSRWMRSVDLPAYCLTGKVAHGEAITELGKCVADIFVYGGQAPSFTSTLLPTETANPDAAFKPAFEEALVRGRVPMQDTALFVALDDPLAVIDDLNMNLVGRLLEQSQFEALHQHQLQSALAVQNLCGFDAEPFIPSSMQTPVQRQVYTDDLYTLLSTHDEVERAKELVTPEDNAMVMMGAGATVAAGERAFKARWGHLPDQQKWRTALEEWEAKRYWREDVRFDEVRNYLSQTTVEATQLQAHIQRSADDLIDWLDQLNPGAETVYHDTGHVDQASQLLETAHALYTALGNVERGQQWLLAQAAQPSKLFGTALYNFNPELAALIKQVTHNFSTTGKLDDQGREGDGHSPTLNPRSPGDATSIGTRFNEIKAVLDLESVRDSQLYQAMSSTAKQAMNTLLDVANHKARDAWHGLSLMLLPAMKQQLALTLAVPQVLISTEISMDTQLVYNPNYQREYQAWLLEVATVQNKIASSNNALRHRAAPHDQRAARHFLRAQEDRLKHLFLQRPNQISAQTSGPTRLHIDLPQINRWLSDLGKSEVIEQLKTFGTQEHLRSTKAWMNQNLGNALPALLVGLNAWNLHHTAKQAKNDGRFSADEWRNVSASAAYAGNAIAALWVGPAWNRAGMMTANLGSETLKVAQAGYSEWINEARAASAGSAKATAASEMATLSKGLIWRTVTWAALGAVASGLEAWQLSNDIDGATSEEEKGLLIGKFIVVSGMSFVATIQMVGAGLGYWFGFAWVMSNPVIIILAILGIAYLMVSMAANRYKREGLRLWLYRCTWGRGSIPEWHGDEGHFRQMQALLETLQRPSVGGRALSTGGGSTPRKNLGFWLQIQVPNALAGKDVTLQPAMIQTYLFYADELQSTKDQFYDRFLNGYWIDPNLLGQLPDGPGTKDNPADYIYTGKEQHRLWQVWIEFSKASPVLELEIKYPPGVLQRADGRGYMFRIALELSTSEADRANNAFSGELKEKDGIVLKEQQTQLLKLSIPN
ncbi:T6SS effector BTH_I2691 family protein [Pseudomonas sp. SDO55104_S430]